MNRLNSILCFFLGFSLALSSFAGQAIPEFMGDWRGSWIDPVETYHQLSPQITAQVIGLGGDEYRVIFREEFQRRAKPVFEAVGELIMDEINIAAKNFNCRITNDSITGAGFYKSKEPVQFELSKFNHVSPTMGRPAPEEALVLFDGTSLDAWQHSKDGTDWDPTWRIVDGEMEIFPRDEGNKKGEHLYTKRKFKSCELHIEFFLPYQPSNRGQGRANSGVFLQGIFEVQILDSYGLIGDWTECGALYKVSPPKVNRCAPPGKWQTFDIIFHAPQYDKEGKLMENAVMTVLHNGSLIHNQQELFEVTYNTQVVRLQPPPGEAAPIWIQDHDHPIRFRNIWVRELE